MNVTTSKYKLLNDINTSKKQFKEILSMIQYECLYTDKGIMDSEIQLFKFKDIKRFILYIEVKKIEENLLFEVFDYYFKKYKINEKNSVVFIVLNIGEKNILADYFLSHFLVLPNKNNGMKENVPILIDSSNNLIYVGNCSECSIFDENLRRTYNNIKSDIRDFMNLYYMVNNVELIDYYKEIEVKKDKKKKSQYKKYSRGRITINKYNIKEFYFKNYFYKVVIILSLMLLSILLNGFDNLIIALVNIYIKLFSKLFLAAYTLKYIIDLNYLLNNFKIKLDTCIDLKNKIVEFLINEKYKKINDTTYRKRNLNFIFLNNTDDLSYMNDKNSIYIIFNAEKENIEKLKDKKFIVLVSEKENYLYIYNKFQPYRKTKLILRITSYIYSLTT